MSLNKKRAAIVAKLLNLSFHYLGELDMKFVVLLENTPQVFSNADPRHAAAILEDAASLTSTLRERTLEAQIQAILDQSQDGEE